MAVDGGHPVQVTRHGGLSVLAAPEGRFLYYKRSGGGPVYTVREDGADDQPATDEPSFAFLPFAVSRSGLWFVSAPTTQRPEWALRVMRFADHKTSDAARFNWVPNGLALSVSPDEKHALLTRIDTSGTDLLLVNDFR